MGHMKLEPHQRKSGSRFELASGHVCWRTLQSADFSGEDKTAAAVTAASAAALTNTFCWIDAGLRWLRSANTTVRTAGATQLCTHWQNHPQDRSERPAPAAEFLYCGGTIFGMRRQRHQEVGALPPHQWQYRHFPFCLRQTEIRRYKRYLFIFRHRIKDFKKQSENLLLWPGGHEAFKWP